MTYRPHDYLRYCPIRSIVNDPKANLGRGNTPGENICDNGYAMDASSFNDCNHHR